MRFCVCHTLPICCQSRNMWITNEITVGTAIAVHFQTLAMKIISLEKERIHVDYTMEGIPDSVKNFQPDAYRDGDQYYLILGDNIEGGVFGCGTSLEEAMQKWDEAYREKRGLKN